MEKTSALRQVLKERFYPFVESHGFVRGKATSLFTPFRRVRGDKIHVFDVQWDKSGRPRFVLNFGEASIAGVKFGGEHVPADKVETQHCQAGRLQRRRGGSMGTWFQLRKPWLESIKTLQWSYEPEAVVSQTMDAFLELETWWETKHEGPHVYIWNAR